MDEQAIGRIGETVAKVRENVERVIIGKGKAAELAICTLLCEGHLLIEDVPGIGKTTLARAIALSLGCSFRRIQCTPDLLPSDITGTAVFNQATSNFDFRPGPVMAQVVLVDEINRATPRSQSAFLEAMQERQVTADGETRRLPRPFMVLATQNPIELEGTFPLPEAQLDRFLLRIEIGYPTPDDDLLILNRYRAFCPLDELKPVITPEELLGMQAAVCQVHMADDIASYIIKLIHATRGHPSLELGASPRAMLALYHSAQALAALRGRAFVVPDDIKYLVPFVLAHRVIPKVESQLRGQTARQALAEVLDIVPVPVEETEAPGR